jgi:hypothetical protein
MKPIACREFRNEKTGDRIVASVYTPRQVDDETWSCRFDIRGLSPKQRFEARGVDSLQALSEALQGIRLYLAESKTPVSCYGGEVGDYFIYKPLAGFDVAMTRHLERLVQREITKLVRETVRRRRAKAKKAARPKRSATGLQRTRKP